MGILLALSAETARPQPGQIDGKTAFQFSAYEAYDRNKPISSALEVHLVPEGSACDGLIFPANTWIQPPAGRYKSWLEGPGWISPYTSVVQFRPQPFRGKGMVSKAPVVPAGLLALEKNFDPGATVSLRLLHLDSHQGPYLQQELSRCALGEERWTGLRMPAGRVIAALLNEKTQEYVGLARPVTVVSDQLTWIRPALPQPPATDLLVRLERPQLISSQDEDRVALVLRGEDGRTRPPDVEVATASRIHAVWFGLHARVVDLEASSPTLAFKTQGLRLRPGKIEHLRGHLRALPRAQVQIAVPEELRQAMSLAVLQKTERGWQRIRQVPLAADTTEIVLEQLPPAALDLVLHCPPWKFHQQIDLQDSAEEAVLFNPAPIHVDGVVYRGSRGVAATVAFQANRQGDQHQVSTDEQGRYHTVLFRPGLYLVTVQAADSSGPPYIDLLADPIRDHKTIDFFLAEGSYRVNVVAEEDGKGIAGAQVTVDNRFTEQDQEEQDLEKTISSRATADSAGVAILPPLRPGEAVIRARAEGYLPSESLHLEVEPHAEDEELTLRLQKTKPEQRLRLLLPDGKPALGAQIRAQSSLANAVPLWYGSTDAQGIVQLPREAIGSVLLVRHPQAGFLVQSFQDEGTTRELVWTLPAAAPPLWVKVRQPSTLGRNDPVVLV